MENIKKLIDTIAHPKTGEAMQHDPTELTHTGATVWISQRAREELAELQQRLAAAESRTCELQENSDTDSGAWLGECGATWTFIDNDPKQNSCVYCPQCGGKLVIAECSQQEDSGSEGE